MSVVIWWHVFCPGCKFAWDISSEWGWRPAQPIVCPKCGATSHSYHHNVIVDPEHRCDELPAPDAPGGWWLRATTVGGEMWAMAWLWSDGKWTLLNSARRLTWEEVRAALRPDRAERAHPPR